MPSARLGAGMVGEIALAVRAASLEYWGERLAERHAEVAEPTTRFDETVVPFRDPHGLPLSLVGLEEERASVPWGGSPVPAEHQALGIHAVRIRVRDLASTARLLEHVMGFARRAEHGDWVRFAAGEGSGTYVDLKEDPRAPMGRWGVGGVHHVAFRVADDDAEVALRSDVEASGLAPTPVIDRFWFHSVYFREPGGTLFELATDGPGFDRDEERERLGERLVLPPWLESRRGEIEASLPGLEMPAVSGPLPAE